MAHHVPSGFATDEVTSSRYVLFGSQALSSFRCLTFAVMQHQTFDLGVLRRSLAFRLAEGCASFGAT